MTNVECCCLSGPSPDDPCNYTLFTKPCQDPIVKNITYHNTIIGTLTDLESTANGIIEIYLDSVQVHSNKFDITQTTTKNWINPYSGTTEGTYTLCGLQLPISAGPFSITFVFEVAGVLQGTYEFKIYAIDQDNRPMLNFSIMFLI